MEVMKFYSKCIFPTPTLTGGKYYEVINEGEYDITIVNDKGNTISTSRYRFDDIKMEKEMQKKSSDEITCIDNGKFSNITKGKTYKIVNETDSYYKIKNDKGYNAIYSKKYFAKMEAKEEVSKPEKPKVSSKNVAVCIYPVANELSFKKEYAYKNITGNHVLLTNDKGESKKYLVKRFKINK